MPFYNVEKYIEECIRSLYDQDIPQEEYEVICVDDCSPDGSREIVERLQKEYKTLRLICHDRNKKLGGARNTGLKEANGEYIWFVDSDDTISPNVLKTILISAEKSGLDILQFDYHRANSFCQILEPDREIQVGENYLFENNSQKWYDKLSGAWQQLFRREFLCENELQFVEDVMFEDTDYLLHAFLVAQKVQHISIYAYNYRVNESSVTKSSMTPIKIAWRVNLLVRCGQLIEIAIMPNAHQLLGQMISHSLSSLRNCLKHLTLIQKQEYLRNLSADINTCKPYINWRTWLAIRYGITFFI